MHTSKMLLSLTAMVFIVSVTTTASANSSCNNRSGISRTAASNPEKREQSKTVVKKDSGPAKKRSGKK